MKVDRAELKREWSKKMAWVTSRKAQCFAALHPRCLDLNDHHARNTIALGSVDQLSLMIRKQRRRL